MNSSKLLRVGIPALGLCVFAFVQTGCRSEVLKERASVPPAEREMFEDDAAKNKNMKAENSFEAFDEVKKAPAQKTAAEDKNFQYPKFEDTAHTPIYSAPKGGKTTAGAASVYIVRRGDTLGKIAARHRIKTIDLAKANNLSLNSIIRVNQKLQIPGGKAVASAKKSSSTKAVKSDSGAVRSGLYTVRRGDSIYIIAKRLKVKRADLMAVNNLTPQSVLRPGQTLKLPGAKVVNEESVVEVKETEQKSDTSATSAKTQEKSKEESGDDALLRDLEADVAKTSNAKTESAAETVGDAAAKTSAAPASGTPVEVANEIHIDDYCKQHKINKADLLKLNSNLNENSILKPNTVFLIP